MSSGVGTTESVEFSAGFSSFFKNSLKIMHMISKKNRKDTENNYFLTLYPVKVAKAIGLFVSSDTVTL